MPNNAQNHFSSAFCFLNLTLRKISIIFRLGVCTYLVPINIQQSRAEQENNGASNLCLVLHNSCLLVHSVFMIRKRKALTVNNILCQPIMLLLGWYPTVLCEEKSWYENAYSVLSLVPLNAWDCISLKPFLTRFLPRTQCYKFQFAVKCTYHQGQRTEHSIM